MTTASGVIVLHKPAGMTSHDCVARIRRLYQTKKVGHTGTLDPDVTGVLPICVGHATRIVEYLQELPKAYEAVMSIGTSTTTEDASGEVIESKTVDPSTITEETVLAAIQKFLGEIDQVPPMYSAVKINGQRLYDLAREGKTIERQSRRVTIYELKLHRIEKTDKDVQVAFYVKCSKGTYVRTLCVDLGQELGYPAHMASLVRVESGPFGLDQAIPLAKLEEMAQEGEDLGALLIPVEDSLGHLPRYDIPPDRAKAVLNGLTTALPGFTGEEGSLVRIMASGRLIGLHRVHFGPKGPFAKPEKVFHT
ncbi:tRNA pseudouridine(55) synthase TruB [Brevibacillus dissolubilis]|uniref:tRNA pseudouridine(55) synthase TruB n=1 Tax=Brevibacillus dissolubilis TaxID=1844116 RepID=UPI0011170D6B|nr:tRNA pseudouridine(55) synthase TruB [Brevibacillus dissolubilis]